MVGRWCRWKLCGHVGPASCTALYLCVNRLWCISRAGFVLSAASATPARLLPSRPPGAYYVAPNLFKTTVRPITSDQQRFFQRIPLAGCAAAALAFAFCQCLIYQVGGGGV